MRFVMKFHEREYFVSRIRSGIYIFNSNNITLKVLPPTIEDELFINEAFRDAYVKAMQQGLMTEEDMIEWMVSKNLWSQEEDEKIQGVEKDIDNLKKGMFNARFQTNTRETGRRYLRAAEKTLKELISKKEANYQNTCEGVAFSRRITEQMRRCVFCGNEPYDFKMIDEGALWMSLASVYLKESEVREVARTEPWRSIWLTKDDTNIPLFDTKDRGLNVDQRNILVWSKMYDNVQESMECPSNDVINDDDLLDGWFIVQREKQESEKSASEVDSAISNDKISNSQEIFVTAQTREDANKIEAANSYQANMIKKEREAVLKRKGTAVDLDFRDRRLELQQQSNELYKSKFRR